MEEKIKILIVDDEVEVRQLLQIMLRKWDDLEIVGEASNVDAALELARKHHPHLVLLDIQMPEKDGFMLIDELRGIGHFPGIIFVTAFENYAIRAIRNAAFDYLIKPIDKEELFGAIHRFKDHRERNIQPDLNELVDILQRTKPERLRFNTRSGYFFLNPDDIMFIKADGNYSHIYLSNNKTEISTISLGTLEKMIEKYTFLRISRSYIINMRYISRVDRGNNTLDLEYEGLEFSINVPAQKIKILEGYF